MSKELNLPFYHVFSDCIPDGELGRILKSGIVREMTIDSGRRELRLTLLFSEAGIEPERLRPAIEAALCEVYGLSGVTLSFGFAEPENAPQEHEPAWAENETEERTEERTDEEREQCCGKGNGPEEDEFDAALRRTEEYRLAALREISLSEPAKKGSKKKEKAKALLGRVVNKQPTPMRDVVLDSAQVLIRGRVFAANHRELKRNGAWVISFDMTDYTSSVRVSKYMQNGEARSLAEAIVPGLYLAVEGRPTFNRFENEMTLDPVNIFPCEAPVRQDVSEEKRVELHLHTKMSAMDALTDTRAAVQRAISWGHPAIAITDHGVVQSFPDAAKAAKGREIKILYGTEGYLLNDLEETTAVRGTDDQTFDGEFVCFDLETTGLYQSVDKITEIGAVLLKNGEIVERFHTFADPGMRLTQQIVELTGITNEMLKGAPSQEAALRAFLKFAGNRVLVAHNADFDIGFLEEGCRLAEIPFSPTVVDTLTLSRNLLPKLQRHKLDLVAGHLGLPDFRHHRATDDAETAALILLRLFEMLKKNGCAGVQEINKCLSSIGDTEKSRRPTRHIILLAKNQQGLRNLYRLVTLAHLKYFRRHPVIPKSILNEYREGLILGSACESGELFTAVVERKSWSELLRIAAWYDYLEIQPICNNAFLLRNGKAKDEEELREFNRIIVRLGKELGKPVCATGDVHFLEEEDEVYRHILLAAQKYEDCDEPLPLYFRTTDEMLREFSYLGEDVAREVVIRNPNKVAGWCEPISPLPKGLFPPRLNGSAEELKRIVWSKAEELYGENPPQVVTERIEAELGDIIRCNYDVIYMSPETCEQVAGKRLFSRLPRFRRLVFCRLSFRHHGGKFPAAPLPLSGLQKLRVFPGFRIRCGRGYAGQALSPVRYEIRKRWV
jgi:DNA polymerase-3 subunit alpha (Gram-positive type)